MIFYSEIRNENNVKLEYYGSYVYEKVKDKITPMYCEPTDKVEMSWSPPLAKHNEFFVEKFSREENGIRIYNITDNWVK